MLLAIYDLSGIQAFLFSSNKLKEISGASTVVHDALFSLIPKQFGVPAEAWKEKKPVSLTGGEKKKIVYIGGGNALLLYDTEETCRAETRKLEKSIFLLSGGGIRLCSAWIQLDESASLAENQKKLMAQLDVVKKKGGNGNAAPAFPVTAYDNNNYEPLIAVEDGKFLSAVRYAKLRAAETSSPFEALCPPCRSFMQDFKSVRREDGKNYQAVIHIDGNTMGIRIREFVSGLAGKGMDVFGQLAAMRGLSVRISELYQNTVRKALEQIYPAQEKPVPFRPIVADGDDITVMIAAKDAFPFVKAFMENLKNERIEEFGGAFLPTAAAGIVFVGLKFPFSIAYDMAEACCKNAKRVTIARCGGAEEFGRNPVSSFDFQLCVSNIPDDLAEYRRKYYTHRSADGKDFTLLRRPYLFCGDSPYSAEKFLRLSEDLHNGVKEKSIARSKLKGLRNAYGISVLEAEQYARYITAHAKNETEQKTVKRFGFDAPFTENGEARFFDILDIMDLIWEEKKT